MVEIEDTEVYKECVSNGYHDWEIIDVAGTLPQQEINCICSKCEFEHTFGDIV